jgi:hypothetical protein
MMNSLSRWFDNEARRSSPSRQDGRDATRPAARRYVLGVFAVVAIVLGGFGAALALLGRLDMLPPPPLTATTCIDEKFKFLAERDLRDVDLVAVGSSVTWRNLDVTAFRDSGLARQPINAAPCYLHLSEVVYYTDFLLSRMRNVATVVSVVAPRDFERCTTPSDAFFPSALAGAYVFDGMPPFPIYVANLVPHKFVRDVLRIRQMRSDPNTALTLIMDDHGAGPLRASSKWLPEPAFDEMCFAALSALERTVVAHGAKLIVATMPLQPEWRALHDPDGQLMAAFEQRVRAALIMPSTLFHAGSQAAAQSLSYADAVHFLWDSAVRYSAHFASIATRATTQEATGSRSLKK